MVDCVAKLFVSVVFADSSAPTLWCYLLSPSLPSSLVLGNSRSGCCWTDGCWVFIHQPFCHVQQTCKWLHYFFWDSLTLQHSVYIRDGLATTAVFTALTNWVLRRFVFTFNFTSTQVNIESKKTPRGKKSPWYKVSENNFRFDKSTLRFW